MNYTYLTYLSESDSLSVGEKSEKVMGNENENIHETRTAYAG